MKPYLRGVGGCVAAEVSFAVRWRGGPLLAKAPPLGLLYGVASVVFGVRDQLCRPVRSRSGTGWRRHEIVLQYCFGFAELEDTRHDIVPIEELAEVDVNAELRGFTDLPRRGHWRISLKVTQGEV
jgi:hypothetical protein